MVISYNSLELYLYVRHLPLLTLNLPNEFLAEGSPFPPKSR